MDAGTVVALALGSAGFIWGAVTCVVNRRDAKERDMRDRDDELRRRWLAERRIIYAKAQAALSECLAAERQAAGLVWEEEFFRENPDKLEQFDGIVPHEVQDATRESSKVRTQAAMPPLFAAWAELGLIATGPVLQAFQ